jgi:hypothetical protein
MRGLGSLANPREALNQKLGSFNAVVAVTFASKYYESFFAKPQRAVRVFY